MAILAECPRCHRKQAGKNKFCIGCGNDLDKAKRSKRVKYWITYRMPGGKQRRELIGTSIAEARDAEGKRWGQKRENRIWDMIPESDITYQELADWYLQLEETKSRVYYPNLKSTLKHFLEVFGDTSVRDTKSNDLGSYQVQMQKKNWSSAYIDKQIEAAKNLVNKAFDNDLIHGNCLKPFRKVKKMTRKGDNARTRVLSYSEYLSIYNALRDHIKPLFAMGFWTGMRRGEILKLEWQHIDLSARIIRLPAGMVKERKAKTIPISKRLRSIVMQIPDRGKTDHIFTYAGKPIKDFSQGLESACRQVGIVYGRSGGDGFIFHDLRRTFTTNARRAGIPKNIIMAIQGHSRGDDMNARYDRISESDLIDAIDKLEVFFQNVDQNVDQTERQESK